MSKRLSREEMTAYQQKRRARLKAGVAPPCQAHVNPVKPVQNLMPDVETPAAPCPNCAHLAAEVARLTSDNNEGNRQRVIIEQVNRISSFSRGHVIGSTGRL